MNDDLEQILLDQPLRRPSASLDDRVARMFDAPTGGGRWKLAVWSTVGAAMAACLAVAATINTAVIEPKRATPNTPATARTPIRIEEIWSRVTPGRLLLTEDDHPVRPLLLQHLSRTRWLDEAENTRIELTVPEQRIVLVDAPVQ